MDEVAPQVRSDVLMPALPHDSCGGSLTGCGHQAATATAHRAVKRQRKRHPALSLNYSATVQN